MSTTKRRLSVDEQRRNARLVQRAEGAAAQEATVTVVGNDGSLYRVPIPNSRGDISTVLDVAGKHTVLLLGMPGIGKSESVKQYAMREAAREGRIFVDMTELPQDVKFGGLVQDIVANPHKYYVYVDMRLTETEPVDLLGLPAGFELDTGQKKVKFYDYRPPLWAVALSLPGVRGMLFLDELTNVERPDVQAAAYKLVLDRKAGFLKFSDGVKVVAAGNTPEHSSIANELPAPLINRMTVVEAEPPTFSEWLSYMSYSYGDDWDRSVAEFLMYSLGGRDECLESAIKSGECAFISPPKSAAVMEQFPSPRSWTRLALQLRALRDAWEAGLIRCGGKGNTFETQCRDEILALAEGNVGRRYAEEYMKFASTRIRGIEEIISELGRTGDLRELARKLLSETDNPKVAATRYLLAIGTYLAGTIINADRDALFNAAEAALDAQEAGRSTAERNAAAIASLNRDTGEDWNTYVKLLRLVSEIQREAGMGKNMEQVIAVANYMLGRILSTTTDVRERVAAAKVLEVLLSEAFGDDVAEAAIGGWELTVLRS